MQRFRTVLFWCHLIAGVSAGIVILIMSVTGVLLTYEKQMMYWADTRAFAIAPSSASGVRLPVDTLLERVSAARPDTALQSLTLRRGATEPASVVGPDGTLYLDPYNGAVLGSGSPGLRSFFRSVTNWHRWLAMSGEQRAVGRAITGAGNLIFLFIVCSGLYLWFPRMWTWIQFKQILWFRRRLPGKARDFNWHNVAGFWSAIPLAIVVASGAVISYPWASNLVYRAVGEQPPAVPSRGPADRPGGPAAARAGRPAEGPSRNERGARGGSERQPRQGRREDRLDAPAAGARAKASEQQAVAHDLPGVPLETLWTQAERQVPAWRTITARIGAGPAVAFTIDRGTAGQPQKRAQLTLDRASGKVVRFEPFSSQTKGRQLRSILRFAHTGEVLGVLGQTVAGIVSAGGALLVYTGLALAWRRLVGWRRRQSSARDSADAPVSQTPSSSSRAAARRAEARPALD